MREVARGRRRTANAARRTLPQGPLETDLRLSTCVCGHINALHKRPELAEQVLTYRAFSDIAFNPERSINCQAYAAALYVSLCERGLLTDVLLRDQSTYLSVINTGSVSNAHEDTDVQARFD